jgi:putative transposase
MEFFHVLNRGIDKRNVVLNDSDRMRFVHGLYLFNDRRPVRNDLLSKRTSLTLQERKISRDTLVSIHAWCLMNNHYHLFLSPVEDDASNLSLFMKKLNMGYAKYYNEKYTRSGYLWQGKYKKIHIERDSHFNYIPYYIHLNPLDYTNPKWRNGRVLNLSNALKSLQKYRWSSYLDHIGEDNFPYVIENNHIEDNLGSKYRQEKEIYSIITDSKLANYSKIIE